MQIQLRFTFILLPFSTHQFATTKFFSTLKTEYSYLSVMFLENTIYEFMNAYGYQCLLCMKLLCRITTVARCQYAGLFDQYGYHCSLPIL